MMEPGTCNIVWEMVTACRPWALADAFKVVRDVVVVCGGEGLFFFSFPALVSGHRHFQLGYSTTILIFRFPNPPSLSRSV